MPFAQIRGVSVNYEIVGNSGPVLALIPGGRRACGEFVSLAHKIAAGGFRVLLHELLIEDTGADLVPFNEWAPHEDETASAFIGLMKSAPPRR